jgi:hypothetical protein
MAAVDHKDRSFYDSLTEEERKKFSLYLMLRWSCCVTGGTDIEHFYLISANERLNKHFFAINKHPKLQWLCTTSVSPGLGTQNRKWIPLGKKDNSKKSLKKKLMELYPTYKEKDIDVLCSIVSEKDVDKHLEKFGDIK